MWLGKNAEIPRDNLIETLLAALSELGYIGQDWRGRNRRIQHFIYWEYVNIVDVNSAGTRSANTFPSDGEPSDIHSAFRNIEMTLVSLELGVE